MSGALSSAACGTGNSTVSAGSGAWSPPSPGRSSGSASGLSPCAGMPADPVDFPEPRAGDEGIPLSRREPQDRPLRAPAVANPDLAFGQVRCLDAVAVGEAEGTLDPSRVHLLTHRHLPAVSAIT